MIMVIAWAVALVMVWFTVLVFGVVLLANNLIEKRMLNIMDIYFKKTVEMTKNVTKGILDEFTEK